MIDDNSGIGPVAFDEASADVSSQGLQSLIAALLDCITPAEVVEAVVTVGMTILGARAGLVALVSADERFLDVVRISGYSEETIDGWQRFPLADHLPLSDAVRENTILLFTGTSDWRARYPEMVARVPSGHFQAASSLPLSARGRVFGGLHFSFPHERQFHKTEIDFLTDLSRLCALSLDRSLLVEQTEKTLRQTELARDEAQRAGDRLAFLARAGSLLGESLDYRTRLEALVRLFVPEICDWAGVDTLDEHGNLVRLSVAHRVPELERVMRDVQRMYPPVRGKNRNALTVIETGEPLFYPDIPPELLDQGAVDTEHARLLKEIGVNGVLCLPLQARGNNLGALTLGMGPLPQGTGRPLSSEIYSLAEEVARRAGAAIDNARLYNLAQRESEEREIALRATETAHRRTEAILESIGEMFYALDSNFCFTYVNRLTEEAWGRTREELLGRNAWELFPQVVETQTYMAVIEAMRQRRIVRLEAISPLRERWAEYSIYPADDGGLLVYFRDIHDRKIAEEQVRRSREDLQFAISAARLGTFYCDFPLDKIVWNETCKNHFFIPQDQDVDFDLFYSLLHPDDREPTRIAIERAMAERVQYNVEYRTCGPEGQFRWVNAVGRFYYDSQDDPIRFDGITIDITERKQAELELNAHAEQEALLNRIGREIRADTHPDAIQETVVRMLGEQLKSDRCFYVLYNAASDLVHCYPDFHRADLPSLAGDYPLSLYREALDRLFAKGTVVQTDTWASPHPEVAEALRSFGHRAVLAVPLHSGDEVVAALFVVMTQPRSWSRDEIALVEQVATITRSALETALITQRDHEIAERLQAALQPAIPNRVPGLELAHHYRSALDESEIGGDFADVFSSDKGESFLVVGDLAGKGLAAASQIATVLNTLRYALYNTTILSDAITHLNNTVALHGMLSGFATLFVGRYDAQTRTLIYVNCGQEAGILVRASGHEVELLGPTGPVFGSFEAVRFREVAIRLEPGDMFAIFTDGLTEIGANRLDMLGIEGMAELIALNSRISDPNEVLSNVVSAALRYGRGIIRDDQCMLLAIVGDP